MTDFEFPTNIKQIGSIGDGMRVYMEDYVHTYLQQYTEAGGYDERIAFLIGRTIIIDGQTILFISGAVQGLHSVAEKEHLVFTEKSWKYAADQMKRYFKGLEVVGWAHAQPGYGVRLSNFSHSYHGQYFNNYHQVAFIMDPIEKMNAFYIWDENVKQLVEIRGYFIYYDKNRGMHEYMLDNKITNVKSLEEHTEEDDDSDNGTAINLEDNDPPPVSVPISEKRTPIQIPITSQSANGKLSPEAVMQRHQRQRFAARKTSDRRIINMLVSVSAVLLIISFVLGATLIQNDGRIADMENQLTLLNTAYRDLLLERQQERAEAAFAPTEPVQGATIPPDAQLFTEDGNDILHDLRSILNPSQTQEAAAMPPPANRAIPSTYMVEPGDTLLSISQRIYGHTGMVEGIMQLNNIEDPNMIFFGMILQLPEE